MNICMFCLVVFVCMFRSGYSQEFHAGDTVSSGAKIARVYNIYEINDVRFSYDTYGKALLIRPKYLRVGKQYFNHYRIPFLFKMHAFKKNTKARKGIITKRGLGSSLDRVDTTIYTGIQLKYPLEIDREIHDKAVSRNEAQPLIIETFQFVKQCATYPFKHFEVTTKKDSN